MPEGPSIVILKEQASAFEGRRMLRVAGNTTIAKERLHGRTVQALRSWGKHFLIDVGEFALRVHFLLFGSYRINERAHTRRICPRCKIPFVQARLGVTNRRSFFCEKCQVRY